jgi:hypothetical protein
MSTETMTAGHRLLNEVEEAVHRRVVGQDATIQGLLIAMHRWPRPAGRTPRPPIEQQGTYPLAEAQLDRFMMKLRIECPKRDEEREILERVALAPSRLDGTRAADSVVLDANALEDIRNTRSISAVHLRGAAVDRAAMRARWSGGN